MVLLSKLTIPTELASNKLEIGADVRYLVCREVCVPGRERLSLSWPTDEDSKSLEDAIRIRKAESDLPQTVPEGVHLSVTADRDSFTMKIDGAYSRLRITDFIPADTQVIENSAKPELLSSLGSPVFIRLKKSEQLDHPISQLRGLVIAGDRAYSVAVLVAASGKSTGKNRSQKPVSQKRSSPKKNQE